MTNSTSIGLTIYGPEVAKAGLSRSLDSFIGNHTGLMIEERFLVLHSAQSIFQFYSLTDSTSGAHWPLVEDLFDMRPACVTLWRGENALNSLQKIKGATQPANALSGTIRSLFWCDNAVTNLLHVSDAPELMQAELKMLRPLSLAFSQSAWDAQKISTKNIWPHSSLASLLSLLITARDEPYDIGPGLPISGAAIESAQIWIAAARRLNANKDDRLSEATQNYLNGELQGFEQLMQATGPVSAWTRLVLKAGISSNKIWSSMQMDMTKKKVNS
ncbi:MAG: nucleoside-diphosphate kinase [Hyphomicrobiales bacterium]|nr:MAG: nucleoside-diphosphate kinase [Hyphomicrobiales bacterium]